MSTLERKLFTCSSWTFEIAWVVTQVCLLSISFPEPTCLLVSTKRRVGSGNEIGRLFVWKKIAVECMSRDQSLSYACVAGSWRAIRSHATLCRSHNAWLFKREKQRRRSCRGNVQKRHHYIISELFRRWSILDHSYKVRASARVKSGRVTSKWGANPSSLDFMRQIASGRKLFKCEAGAFASILCLLVHKGKITRGRRRAKNCYDPK